MSINKAEWNTYATTFDTNNLSSATTYHHQVRFHFRNERWLERICIVEDGKHIYRPPFTLEKDDGRRKFGLAQKY